VARIDQPPADALPSPQRLRRWTIIAAAGAALVVVAAVLPAERAIDPTGIGRLIGLTQMGEIKVALAQEVAEHEAEEAAARADSAAAAKRAADSVNAGTQRRAP
jgi:hypothetical protein